VDADENWDGRKDPLFIAALQVVHETLEANAIFDKDLRPMFKLQMAYLLLWSAIERYASLRYHLGEEVSAKIKKIAKEDKFKELLHQNVKMNGERKLRVQRADRPEEHYEMNPEKPEKCLDYYYQVRSNITHRGKAVETDHVIVEECLRELLNIFEGVLSSAFEISSNFNIDQGR
jgi:hypothetical protein